MECKDVNCPTHGNLATRGMLFEGEVVSDKMQGTVIVKRDRFVKVKKYDRIKRSTSRIPVHNPPCIDARTGDVVRVQECKKLSKTVAFVVIEKIGSVKDEPVKEIEKTEKKIKAPTKKAAKKVDNG